MNKITSQKHALNSARAGFTLVEISVVIAALGLLIGGVLIGRDLVRSSALRSVTTEHEKYISALGAFKAKYLAVPGDMRNAVRFWGAAAGGTADKVYPSCSGLDHTAASYDGRTCNGNGDGLIGTDTDSEYEMLRAWQQLSNAGMVDGQYTGVPSADTVTYDQIGWNVPASRFGSAGWMLYGLGTFNGSVFIFPGRYGNILNFGPLAGASLSPREAQSIDQKIDDGKPHLGRMLSYKNAATPNCINTTNDGYMTNRDDPACIPTFITGY